jgi:hypothetical protein
MATDVHQSLGTDGDEDVATSAGASMTPADAQYVAPSGSADATAYASTSVDAAVHACEAHAAFCASGVAAPAHGHADVNMAEVAADDGAAAAYAAAYAGYRPRRVVGLSVHTVPSSM